MKQLREQYTLAFNIGEIEKLHLELRKYTAQKYPTFTQDIINSLYTNMQKHVYKTQRKNTGMYKEREIQS